MINRAGGFTTLFYLLHAEDLHSIYTGHETLCTIHNPIRVRINQLGTVIIPIDRDSRGSTGVFKGHEGWV